MALLNACVYDLYMYKLVYQWLLAIQCNFYLISSRYIIVRVINKDIVTCIIAPTDITLVKRNCPAAIIIIVDAPLCCDKAVCSSISREIRK